MIESQQFRHKVTGEIVTQVPVLQINDYEPVETEATHVCGPYTTRNPDTEEPRCVHCGDPMQL